MSYETPGALLAPFQQFQDDLRLGIAWHAVARRVSDREWHTHDEVIGAMEDASGLPGRVVGPLLDEAFSAKWLTRASMSGGRYIRVTARGVLARPELRLSPVSA